MLQFYFFKLKICFPVTTRKSFVWPSSIVTNSCLPITISLLYLMFSAILDSILKMFFSSLPILIRTITVLFAFRSRINTPSTRHVISMISTIWCLSLWIVSLPPMVTLIYCFPFPVTVLTQLQVSMPKNWMARMSSLLFTDVFGLTT